MSDTPYDRLSPQEVAALTEALASTPTAWGSSRWGEWRRCRQAHALRYHLGVMPRKRGAYDEEWDADDASYFEIGQLTHSCLGFHSILVRDELVTPLTWQDVLSRAAVGAEGKGGASTKALLEAERLVGAYGAHYGWDTGSWPQGTRVLAVEREMRGDLGGLPYTGRADAILMLPGGEVVVVDTKTRTSRIPGTNDPEGDNGKRWLRGAATRPQFLGLSWLVSQLPEWQSQWHDAPPAVWVNAIVKTKIPTFWRGIVRPTWAAVRQWEAQQESDATACGQLLDDIPREALPADFSLGQLRNYSACAPEIGSRCTYFLHCHGSDEERERYYETEQVKETSQ